LIISFFSCVKRIKKADFNEPAFFGNKTLSPILGNNYTLHRIVITGLYSVDGQQAVFVATAASVFGQRPEASGFGQQGGASSPAQQGLVQSGGQFVLGQQPGVPSTAQHGLVGSSGQVFATEPHSVFSAEMAFSAGQHELAFS
jgi:hypothetical protein